MTYQIDLDMCGENFTGDVQRVAEILRDQGYDVEVVDGARNGGRDGGISDDVWLEALVQAEVEAESGRPRKPASDG